MNDPMKKYRRQFRMWKDSRRLRRENEFYVWIFTKLGLSVPDENNLKQELKKDFLSLQPKRKDHRVLSLFIISTTGKINTQTIFGRIR